jgi:hypothetical protein
MAAECLRPWIRRETNQTEAAEIPWGTGLFSVAVFTHFKLRSGRLTMFSGSGYDRNESLTLKTPIGHRQRSNADEQEPTTER